VLCIRVTIIAAEKQPSVLCAFLSCMPLYKKLSAGNNKIYLGARIKCPIFFFPILNKFGVHWQSFIRVSNIKFYGNPSSGSRADTCEQMARQTKGQRESVWERERRTDGRTDMTKLETDDYYYYYYYYHLHMGYTGWQCTAMQDRTMQYSTIQ